jgi:hypothetical protein
MIMGRGKPMDDKPSDEELRRKELYALIEESRIKGFFEDAVNELGEVQGCLDELAREPEAVFQQMVKDSADFANAILSLTGKTRQELEEHPGGLQRYIGDLARDLGGIRLLLTAVTTEPGAGPLFLRAMARTRRGPLRQVKFECSGEFYKRLMDEKLQRNLTIQQLAIRALERYFAVPESVHRRIEEEAQAAGAPLRDVLRQRFARAVSRAANRGGGEILFLTHPDPDHLASIAAVAHYLEQLPPEKASLVRDSLALDLKYYRTSRFRTGSAERSAAAHGIGRKGRK